MKTFLTIMNSVPAVIAAVQTVEAAIPMPKTGQQKLNLVLGIAGAAYEATQAAEEINKGQLLAGVETITNLTVAALNAAGVFAHSPASVSSN